jgi:hypothetical protein
MVYANLDFVERNPYVVGMDDIEKYKRQKLVQKLILLCRISVTRNSIQKVASISGTVLPRFGTKQRRSKSHTRKLYPFRLCLRLFPAAHPKLNLISLVFQELYELLIS